MTTDGDDGTVTTTLGGSDEATEAGT
jgi:hypothetical protein